MQVSSFERSFIEHVHRGESFDAADFQLDESGDKGTADSVIRADVIRQLLLMGAAVDLSDQAIDPGLLIPTQFGIRLHGAVIEGRLILDGLCGRGPQGLVPLHLIDCTFSGGISARNAVMAELHLTNAVFSQPATVSPEVIPIDLDNIEINGPLDFSGLRGATDTMPCWVSANSARIAGNVTVSDACFFYPARKGLGLKDVVRYGLNLRDAVIEKSFFSSYGLVCHGGLSLSEARVGGNVWILGGHLLGGEGPAFNGQGIKLAGSLIFRPAEGMVETVILDSVAEGEFKLFGATIEGGVWLTGSEIRDHPFQSRPGISDLSVNLGRSRIGSCIDASFWVGNTKQLRLFRCSRKIELKSAIVGDEIRLIGADIGASYNDEQHLFSVSAEGIELGGDLLVNGSSFDGQVYRTKLAGAAALNGAWIKGNIKVARASIAESKSSWFLLKKATVAGAVEVGDLRLSEGIDLAETKIEGNLVLSPHRPSQDSFSRPLTIMINLFQTRVVSACSISADVSNLDMRLCHIGEWTALDVMATGNVSLALAEIHGDLQLNKFRFRCPEDAPTDKHNHLLELKGASIMGNLKVEIPAAEYLDDIVITSAWSSELACYPTFRYMEVEVSRSSGVWYGALLIAPESHEQYEGLYLCGGRSNVFHQLNESGQLDLGSPEKAREYLRLFCSSTWGDDGAFVIAETMQGLPFEYTDGEEFPPGLSFSPQDIHPIEVLPSSTPVLDSDGDERRAPKDERYLLKAFVRYGNGLFAAFFSIRNDGRVEMIEDTLLVLFRKEIAPEFRPPLRKASDFFTRESHFVTDRETGMSRLPGDELDGLRKEAEQLIKQELSPHNFARATIDLRDARVIGLDDDDGAGWGEDVQLSLLNFRYQRFNTEARLLEPRRSLGEKTRRWLKLSRATLVRSFALLIAKLNRRESARRFLQSRLAMKPPPRKDKALRNRIHQRLKWLELQYPKHPDKAMRSRSSASMGRLNFLTFSKKARQCLPEFFEPQPYAQAAAVFRHEGATELARNIDYIQRRMAGRKDAKQARLKRPLILLLHGLYGLSPVRTFIWMLLFVALGGLMTDAANHKGLMIVDAMPVLQSVQERYGQPGELMYLPEQPGRPAGEVLCGDAIEPLLYAADVFIPLLDLEQESRCMIRPAESPIPTLSGRDASAGVAGWLSRLRGFVVEAMPDNVVLWHWMQSLYAVMGWVMLSLFAFTLTHKLRSQDSLVSGDEF